MSDTVYDSLKALNWSSLKYMATSPLLYQYRINHPEPPKTTYLLGSGIHCRVLEPDEFDGRYAECTVTRNVKHGAYQEWLAENEGREALKPAEMEHVKQAGDAVLAHPVAARLLDGCRHEEPLTWIDPDTGMQCKGRVDSICPTYIVDLKSGRDVDPWRFNAAAARYLYHGQLSLYQTGAIATGKIHANGPGGYVPPYIIAVAKVPPYDVAVFQLKPDDLDAGRALCLQLMRRLEECAAADWWPGVAPDLQYLDLPRWAPGMNIGEEEDF